MNCPTCGEKSIVIDSRTISDGSIRRRRKCESCGYRYSTVEAIKQNTSINKVTYKAKTLNNVDITGESLIKHNNRYFIATKLLTIANGVYSPQNGEYVAKKGMVELIPIIPESLVIECT